MSSISLNSYSMPLQLVRFSSGSQVGSGYPSHLTKYSKRSFFLVKRRRSRIFRTTYSSSSPALLSSSSLVPLAAWPEPCNGWAGHLEPPRSWRQCVRQRELEQAFARRQLQLAESSLHLSVGPLPVALLPLLHSGRPLLLNRWGIAERLSPGLAIRARPTTLPFQ